MGKAANDKLVRGSGSNDVKGFLADVVNSNAKNKEN